MEIQCRSVNAHLCSHNARVVPSCHIFLSLLEEALHLCILGFKPAKHTGCPSLLLNMASFSISPTDIISLIFSSLESFEDVSCLASVSRTFHHVRTSDATSIYRAVAARSILCLSDAEALLAVQEQCEAQEGRAWVLRQHTMIHRMKTIVINARIVAKDWADFVKKCRKNFKSTQEPQPRYLTPSLPKTSENIHMSANRFCYHSHFRDSCGADSLLPQLLPLLFACQELVSRYSC